MKRKRARRCVPILAAVLLLAWPVPAMAGDDKELSTEEVLDMSLDDLLEVDIRSVSKKRQMLADAAAAASVLMADDVRRSGHSRLSESLRLLPGFHVAHIDGSQWSVSSRGFAGRFTDKLLVLIDGRSVYSPTFGGVFWDVQDVFLPDLDRIEAIRGPGATLWGANAVNGVVNVLTKSARDTQGTVIQGGGGLVEKGFLGIRHGGAIGENAWYRVFVKGFANDDFETASGSSATDEWHQVRGGFRVDWDRDEATNFTFQGELYGGTEDEAMTFPQAAPPFQNSFADEYDVAGGFLLGRWTHATSGDGEIEVQMFYDRTERRWSVLDEERDTFDIDFQHRAVFKLFELIWGLGYRVTKDRIPGTAIGDLGPTTRTDHLFSAFLQGEFAWCDNRLVLTVGSKFEHNDYTGFEAQPSARLLWKVKPKQSLWVAVSRSVRTPSRADTSSNFNVGVMPGAPPVPTTMIRVVGNPDFDSEELLAFELGYRALLLEGLSLDIATFVNLYDDLRDIAAGSPFPEGAEMVLPLSFANSMDGEIYGGEVTLRWRPSARAEFIASYSYSRAALQASGDRVPFDQEEAEGRYPRNLATLAARFDPSPKWEIDFYFYFTDNLLDLGIPSYARLDFRVGWRPREKMLVELIVRNILDDRHPEFTDELPFTTASEVPTSAVIRATLNW